MKEFKNDYNPEHLDKLIEETEFKISNIKLEHLFLTHKHAETQENKLMYQIARLQSDAKVAEEYLDYLKGLK